MNAERVAATIMVVDDDPDILLAFGTILKQQGYTVRSFPGGMPALKSAAEDPPDLVLLDVRMPAMDGFEVCRQIKDCETLIDIPVIFLSAFGDIEEKVRGFEMGAADFITKPCNQQELLARVKTHLSLRRYKNELKKKTRRLGEQERVYRRLLDNIGDEYVVFSHTPEGIFTFMSPGSKTLFGKRPEELIGSDWRDLRPTAECLEEMNTLDLNTIATGVRTPTVFFHYDHPDGTLHTLECENMPVLGPTGNVNMIDGIAKDITNRLQMEKSLNEANERLKDMNLMLEQRIRERTADLVNTNRDLTRQIEDRMAAETALIESEEKFRRIVMTANEGIVTTDSDYRIIFSNAVMAELFGGTVDQIIGRSVFEFVHDENRKAQQKRAQARAQGERDIYELKIRRLDGDSRWVIVAASPIIDTENRFQGSIAMITDITDRKQSEIKLKQAYRKIAGLKKKIEADNIYLQEEIKLEHNFEEIIGDSDEIKYALYRIEQVAGTDSAVIIFGETGTGKELFARALHSTSNRAGRPLIKVNCAAMPEQFIESELFGHEKGAFTGAARTRQGRFELAHRGTIFLDEIGELPPASQAKLLRVLQDGEFERLGDSRTIKTDVRVIAATNRDLEAMVKAGKFRGDLWFRLNVFPITIPLLRRRNDDIPLLVNHFVKKICKKTGKMIARIPGKVMDELTAYGWPGNVRELEHVLERSIITTPGQTLYLSESLIPVTDQSNTESMKSHADMEREHILSVLERTNWVIQGPNGAAGILDLHPNTLRYRIKKLGIRKPSN